jgi:hypothetical protein
MGGPGVVIHQVGSHEPTSDTVVSALHPEVTAQAEARSTDPLMQGETNVAVLHKPVLQL